jgi:preprotein translocase subunit SecG
MYIVITILIIIVCILLALIVLIQNPKGGGVNATFGGASQQIFGASRTTDVVEKATWTLAVLLLVFSLGSTFLIDKKAVAAKKNATAQQNTTAAPVELDEVSKRLKETGAGAPSPMGQQQPGQQQGQPQPAPQKK